MKTNGKKVNQIYNVRYHEYTALCEHCVGKVSSKLIFGVDTYDTGGIPYKSTRPFYEVICSYPECIRFKHVGCEDVKCTDCENCAEISTSNADSPGKGFTHWPWHDSDEEDLERVRERVRFHPILQRIFNKDI